MWINQFNHVLFDYFFYFSTHLAEFWSCLGIFILVAIFKSYKHAIIGLSAYAIAGLITQLLKRNVFPYENRPTYNIDNLRLIPDYFNFEQHSHFSFPSGHSTAAFSLFLFLTLISQNKNWGYFFGFMAVIIAFSRTYLSQHYFIDTLVGSIIGSAVTFIVFYFLDKKSFGQWGEKRLLKR